MCLLETCLSSPAFALIGVLAVGYLTLSLGWKILRGFLAHVVSEWWKTDLKKYGGWAVVTGATDGIGKAYAQELAKRGFDVVLISRTLEKLKKVAEEIERESGRKTKIIQADFTRGLELYDSIEDGLQGLDIGILVNNVGMTYTEGSVLFLDVTDIKKRTTDIINCNITSMIQMTRIVLPNMVKRKKGLIINLSSEAGTRPYPMMTLYSSTKVFMDFFSRCLNTEYGSQGITVQCVMPLLVSTNMTRRMETNLFVKTPESFAREALNTVGYVSRTSGCLSHSLQSYAVRYVLPDFLLLSPLFPRLSRMLDKHVQDRMKAE
ncbi:very-long-chain 3-oxoacyl-CoA reductase-B-like [Spea bombifrons]|uniref:very-long-chain 3-oxoacyl-CoA reductase-B-like n=1 Tax=Spea bombifrons TaxID=233779 RepID=UPI0023495185|nr:very-long-chain 3-oxoacyl-CoA reductase-B-like [Spea bombifrons]